MRVFRSSAYLACMAIALSACKGGGGGGGAPAPPAGSFTLSASSLTFSAKFATPPPSPQSVLVTLADTTSAEVGAGYGPSIVPPTWLDISVTGSGLQYSFAFFVNQTTLAPGTYTTTVTIGTGDANGNILQTKDVQVTYTIREGVTIMTAPPVLSGVSGSSLSSQSFQINVSAPSILQWAATSSQPWLQPPSGTQTGAGNHTVNVDTSTLQPGQTTATLTLTNVADSTDTATLLVTVNMSAPTLTTSLSAIELGGASGLENAAVPLAFSLGTGSNAYPWTLTATTTSGGNWLTVSSAAGTVAASNVIVDVDADRTLLASGTHTGQLELRATVNGVAVTQTIPVTLRHEGNRLLVSDTGVAFSSFPSRQVLTRTLAVRNTREESGIPWHANSNAAWLGVTLTGDTGDPLVLTANPAGLAEGQHFAEVTVISTSAQILNDERIRVGLTVRAADPTSLIDLPAAEGYITVANPVEPEMFLSDSNDIEVYDVYSGALLRTLSGFTGVLSLAMSAEGLSLYVAQDIASGDRVLELDPVTGAVRRTFVLGSETSFPYGVAYARPDAHPVLITAIQGEIFDAATGTPFTARADGGHSFDVSSDQRYVYTMNNGISPATIYRYALRYSSLAAGGLTSVRLVEQNSTSELYPRSNGHDVAVAASDAIVYAAAGSPYQFDILAPDTLLRVDFLQGAPSPYPNNIETCWNGRVAGGIDDSNAALGDIFVYASTGMPLARLDSGTGTNSVLFARSLRFSGDCTRLASASGVGLRIQDAP